FDVEPIATCGKTGDAGILRATLTKLGAGREMISHYMAMPAQEALQELRPFLAELEELRPEDSRIHERLGRIFTLWELVRDPKWVFDFRSKFPEKNAAAAELERLLSVSDQPKELIVGFRRDYSRFHLVPYWHQGFCPGCEIDISKIPFE